MKTFNISLDSKRIRAFYELSQSELGNSVHLSKSNILRIENNEVYPRVATIEAIYDYSYSHGLDLNKEKSRFFIENACDSTILFHGAKSEIIGDADNKHSLPPNDFGDGFYLGESLGQAATWVCNNQNGSVYCFSFKNDKSLKYKKMLLGREWMYAILYYRGAFTNKKVPQDVLNVVHELEKLDFIIAPIADNKMYQILNSFLNLEITDEACLHALSLTDLGYQYVFKSMKAISSLVCLDRFYLCNKEKEFYSTCKQKNDKEYENKVKMSLIEYRRKGKYFDELFK